MIMNINKNVTVNRCTVNVLNWNDLNWNVHANLKMEAQIE